MKVVEGQLEFWGMVSHFSNVSDSLASQGIREFVTAQANQQAVAPDVLPSQVNVRPTIEAASGKVVDSVG